MDSNHRRSTRLLEPAHRSAAELPRSIGTVGTRAKFFKGQEITSGLGGGPWAWAMGTRAGKPSRFELAPPPFRYVSNQL